MFQTKIRFPGHNIYQGKIIPTDRSIAFVDRFPIQIIAKTQLQGFFGSLNYVADFYPNCNLCKPLHERLKKNPKPRINEHSW